VSELSDLSGVGTSELLSELLRRPEADFLNAAGLLAPEAYRLANLLGIRVCVDGVPVRKNQDGEVELMAIRRGTGPYAGKLCLVGGGVERVLRDGQWVPESLAEALTRHFRVDLGFDITPLVSWDQPQYVAQDMRPVKDTVREGFTPNPNSRHLIAIRYLVQITGGDDPPTFGATQWGGQEAAGVVWFTRQAMPPASEFGYHHDQTYLAMFPIAESLALA